MALPKAFLVNHYYLVLLEIHIYSIAENTHSLSFYGATGASSFQYDPPDFMDPCKK